MKTAAGIALDAVTLTTATILATIALLGLADPTIESAVLPVMATVFPLMLASGITKIALNRPTTHRKPRP